MFRFDDGPSAGCGDGFTRPCRGAFGRATGFAGTSAFELDSAFGVRGLRGAFGVVCAAGAGVARLSEGFVVGFGDFF
jgi:hypothetical protein